MQPNVELKTRPKQLLGSLLLVITLPAPRKGAHTLFTSQREIKREREKEKEKERERMRERKRERARERERERESEKERLFILKRNDGCLGTY